MPDDDHMIFTPSHHAALFGIIAKEAVERAGEDGKNAVLEGVKLYALQRGSRMKKRAIKNGDPLTMSTYRAYCEWIAPAGSIDRVTVQKSPAHVTRNFACPWHTYWRDHGLLSEGYLYCRYIDEYLVRGFNNSLELNVNAVHTDGKSEYCEFVWNGIDLTPENEKEISIMRERVQASAVKNWEYHIGHLYQTIGKVLRERLTNGDVIMQKAKTKFILDYGKQGEMVLEKSKDIDYNEID